MILGMLISGNLGYIALKDCYEKHNIEFVLTDLKSSTIINFCCEHGIEYFLGNPRNSRAFKLFGLRKIDVLVSINYLFLIEIDLINLPAKLAFNIHGSLLPKYRGRTPHVWSIINNESETGITAHLIDESCDSGDIMEQIIVPIDKEDTGADILDKFGDKYLELLDVVLSRITSESVTLTKQQDSIATYFGKRSPEDGRINWNWQKERIYNWVRAQAYPYPGAFTFYKTNKVIIDKIKFTEVGFTDVMSNGLVLSVCPLLVKTPNGVVELCVVRDYDFAPFENDIILE